MEDFIFQIEVPEEEVRELKNGAIKVVKRNVFPGYVLVRMELSDESWSCDWLAEQEHLSSTHLCPNCFFSSLTKGGEDKNENLPC